MKIIKEMPTEQDLVILFDRTGPVEEGLIDIARRAVVNHGSMTFEKLLACCWLLERRAVDAEAKLANDKRSKFKIGDVVNKIDGPFAPASVIGFFARLDGKNDGAATVHESGLETMTERADRLEREAAECRRVEKTFADRASEKKS
jgi:hypothetical protein